MVKLRKLTLKQETFCQNYINDKKCYGNAVESYLKVYNCSYDAAKVNGSKLLTKTNVKQRLEELINEIINDTIVDKELASVITQKENLQAKVNAIKEYNKVKSRIVEKVDVTSQGKKIEGFNFVRPRE